MALDLGKHTFKPPKGIECLGSTGFLSVCCSNSPEWHYSLLVNVQRERWICPHALPWLPAAGFQLHLLGTCGSVLSTFASWSLSLDSRPRDTGEEEQRKDASVYGCTLNPALSTTQENNSLWGTNYVHWWQETKRERVPPLYHLLRSPNLLHFALYCFELGSFVHSEPAPRSAHSAQRVSLRLLRSNPETHFS